MLERNNTIPLYEQLKNLISKDIQSGKYQSEEQIPSERELGERYNVSRITVRQAIALAEREGILYRVHGVGTFVAKPKIKQELPKMSTFRSTLLKQGLVASTELISSEVMTSDFQLSRLLNIDVMDKVYNLQLLGLGDENPIVFYNSYFPYETGQLLREASVESINKGIPFSTLDLYQKEDSLNPTHVEQTFEAKAAAEQVSSALNIAQGFPVLCVTSIVYEDKTPLEYKETYYRGDKYKFFITRDM
ncbi:GntR family transcriptional regulator [Salipaludibacillus sp. CUR1]|uniref:GntR family transcriptional regulator n=1 Tax=Salipaludibacillus sp. CUR1 TaxID=2820003 RepID=UPI001E502558|nr:GntR family transcriptional regulator [Salipaludibacillus sp. CUR1]